MWCLRHILATDGTPRAHHTRWEHQGGLGIHEAGVGDHEACMRAFEMGLCYDQLNICELASFELLARRGQMAELKHKQRSLRDNGSGGLVGDEDFLLLGTNETRGQLMICPQLDAFVAAELGKEGAVLKERRKLAEERKLLRSEAKGKGKGKKGHDGAADGAAAPGGT